MKLLSLFCLPFDQEQKEKHPPTKSQPPVTDSDEEADASQDLHEQHVEAALGESDESSQAEGEEEEDEDDGEQSGEHSSFKLSGSEDEQPNRGKKTPLAQPAEAPPAKRPRSLPRCPCTICGVQPTEQAPSRTSGKLCSGTIRLTAYGPMARRKHSGLQSYFGNPSPRNMTLASTFVL